jgi:hypothetical protein
MFWRTFVVSTLILMGVITGCKHVEVTCYSLSNPCEPEGIPFYLPKPLLVITKNFRSIEDNGYGQLGAAPIPNSFDNQAQYADVKANISSSVAPSTSSTKSDSGSGPSTGQSGALTTAGGSAVSGAVAASVVPPGSFKDGVTPDTYFTYHIVLVPDLTQKYAFKIKGGPGEFRAAMNLVNGWMFTGLGPFYLKDSSTAQNILATGGAITLGGRGVADVVNSLRDLSKGAAGTQQKGAFDSQLAGQVNNIRLMMDEKGLRPQAFDLKAFAEIYVYEPHLQDGQMEWRPIPLQKNVFDRQILGIVTKTDTTSAQQAGGPTDVTNPAMKPAAKPGTQTPTKPGEGGAGPAPQSGPLSQTGNLESQSTITAAGAASPTAAGSPGNNNVTVNVNPERKCCAICNLWPFNKCCKQRTRIVQSTDIDPEERTLSSADTASAISVAGTLQIQKTLGYQPGK